MRLSFLFAFLSIVLLSACANGDKTPLEEQSAQEMFERAEQVLEQEEYIQAAQIFEEVERQHPYSQYATRAQLMSAFAKYQEQNYEEAILNLDRFIELHPGSQDIDYAYYLRALSFYEQISDVGRDQDTTRQALKALEALIQRFPESKYARDAKLKRDLALDHLAGKEMEIGRFYLQRNQINAAINRFLIVIRDFQTTSHVPEALHRLVESYLILGLVDEATRIAAVLGHNYPGSSWYERSYNLLDPEQRRNLNQNRSWIDKTIESLLKRN